MSSESIGLIAGNGSFPLEFIDSVHAQGKKVFVVALELEADPQVSQKADICHWIKVGQFGRLLKLFKDNNITRAAFAGGVVKARIFSGISFDLAAINLIARARSFKDDVLLRKVAEELEKNGTEVISPYEFLTKSVPVKGKLTSRGFSDLELKDSLLGIEAARGIGALDIGQSVVVFQDVVAAVEAVDGTDSCIRRGGEVAKTAGSWNPGKGAVLVKVAKPQQDLRFDLPSIGLSTIENCHSAGITAIAIEAQKSLILDCAATLKLAEKYEIAIQAI